MDLANGSGENNELLTTSSGSGIPIPGCIIYVPPTVNPVEISWGGTAYGSENGALVNLVLMEGNLILRQRGQHKSDVANKLGEIAKEKEVPPSSTARIFYLVLASLGGTANLQGQVDGQATYINYQEVA